MKFLGFDIIKEPIPIRPVAHYSMGGVEADIDGRTPVENIWAAGEVACHSLHGANRLGCNSTAECLVYGGITGAEIAKYLATNPALSDSPQKAFGEEKKRIFEDLINKNGSENIYAIKKELRMLMDKHAGVYREGASMKEGLAKVKNLKASFKNIKIEDKSPVYNSNLINALEVENLIDLAEMLLTAAIARRNRGADTPAGTSRRGTTEIP